MKGWLLAASASVLAAGCFDAQTADCALRCAGDAECPAGQVCLSEGLCAAPELTSCSADPGPGSGASITCNDETTCALVDGQITCWGSNDEGQIPGTASMAPVRLTGSFGGETPVSLDSGLDHFCAITDAGSLYCWGSPDANRTGTGTGAIARLELDGRADSVVGGYYYGCALVAGELHCWGSPVCEEISASPRPEPAGESGLRAVIAGDAFLCVAGEGQLRCRGRNDRQQCGAVEETPALCTDGETPATPNWSNVLEAEVTGGSGSHQHACAIVEGGDLVCWGGASGGKLGNGSTDGTSLPVRVSLPCEARTVAAGFDHTCAVCQGEGEVYCWGKNGSGAVGPELGVEVTTPALVPLPAAVDVCAGEDHSCAITAAGDVYCWGNNETGQLGPGAEPAGSATPVAVPLP